MKRFYFFTISFALFFIASSFLLKAQVPGNGLVFDGDDDYVNVTTTTSDELNPLESLTLECWVYLNDVWSSCALGDYSFVGDVACSCLPVLPSR